MFILFEIHNPRKQILLLSSFCNPLRAGIFIIFTLQVNKQHRQGKPLVQGHSH